MIITRFNLHTPKMAESKPPLFVLQLLQASQAWYRIRSGNDIKMRAFSSIDEPQLQAMVTISDRERAQEIHEYYSQKLLMLYLTDVPLTTFRKELYQLLTTETTTSEFFPMLYRLPEFYEYDLQFSCMKKHMTGQRSGGEYWVSRYRKSTPLHPIKSITRRLKKGIQHEYWFTDVNLGAVKLTLDDNNGCKPLWDQAFSRSNMNVIVKSATIRNQDGLHYADVTKWTLNLNDLS